MDSNNENNQKNNKGNNDNKQNNNNINNKNIVTNPNTNQNINNHLEIKYQNQEKYEAIKRIEVEYDDLNNDELTKKNIGLSIEPIDRENIFKWRCSMNGPRDSPYAGGLFYIKIIFPEDYPQNRPEVCFETPIYHVNINPIYSEEKDSESLGHVCISCLNWWNPIYTNELKYHKDLYDEKIRYFTKKYASSTKTNKYEQNKSWDFTYDKKE